MNNHIDPASATGLVSYWRMNEGTSTTLNDIAGTNNGNTVSCTWDLSVPFNSVPPVPVITYSSGVLYSTAPTGNQWFLGGTPVGGAVLDSLTPVQNGDYTVEVTSPEGCSASSAPFTVLDVNVNDLLPDHTTITVVPNPFHDYARIVLQGAASQQAAAISIKDLQGRMVAEIKNIQMNSASAEIRLNRNNLCAGIYFYELKIEGTRTAAGKFCID
jgi:hypothetical protein